MKLWFFLLALFVTPAMAAEDAIVSDGLTISSYLQAGSNTNIIYSEAVTGTFTTTNGSSTVTVKHAASVPSMTVPITTGTKFSLTGTSATVAGLTMDGTWVIASTPDSTHFTFTHSGTANATVSTPAANTTITYSSLEQDGKFRFFCMFSHLAYDDPIINPGVPGAAHLHLFFGNTGTNANSTYASLRAAGGGTCDGGPLNRTAYWMPAMLDSSIQKVRIPIHFEWYYNNFLRRNLVDFTSPACPGGTLQDGRPIACPQYAIKKIERGMKAIYGFKPSTGAYPSTYLGPFADILFDAWTCTDTSDGDVGAARYRYLSHRGTPSLGLTSDTHCPSTGRIQLRSGNPSCWDGTHDSSDHYIHFAPVGNDGFSNQVCPATHPFSFQTFTTFVSWNYTGGVSSVNTWYLASDRHNGANYEAGETFHWDMFWAWNDTIQQWFHENIQGMSPSSSAGAPYIYNSAGKDYVGGPYMRNTNNGGLGDDCTTLGMSGACSLVAHSGLSDTLVDIPALRRRAKGRMK